MQMESYIKREPESLYESVAQWAKTLKTKCTDNYLETEEDYIMEENCDHYEEGSINNLHKYTCLDSFRFKSTKIIRHSSEKATKTPKHAMHLKFYQDTFESFNDVFTSPPILKHNTIWVKPRDEDEL